MGTVRADCYLHGIGVATPAQALRAEESARLFAQACPDARVAKLLRRVVRLTGVETRYLASLEYQSHSDFPQLYLPYAEQPHGPTMGARNGLFERCAAPLVGRAVGGFSTESLGRVGTLITVSCTHASSPGLERPILSQFPALSAALDRWNLGFMGCSAGLAALRLVRRMPLEGDALLVCCELSSLHFQYTDQLDQLTANLLFSDGAAAALVSPRPSAVRVADCACVMAPEHAGQMVWFASEHGLRLALSQELPDTLKAGVPAAVDALLARHGLKATDVPHWVVHPGGPQILDAVEEALSLPARSLEGSRSVLRRFGNMSSPTVFFILRELIEERVDGWCMMLAFGPGLTIELALLQILRDGSR